MARKPTIHDVARRAGVSTATVSRVLNRTATVRRATEASVREAMTAIRFRPNIIGRQLKTANSRTLGVLVPTLSNPVFADSVHGIQQAARDAGYSVLLAASNYSASNEEEAINSLLSNRVEGLVLTLADVAGNDILWTLDHEEVPYVLIYNQPKSRHRAAVTVDNGAAFGDMVRHLIGLGHRRFAMVAGSFAASDRSPLRYHGFIAALADAGLPAGDLIEVRFDDAHLSSKLREVFARPNPPSALVCSNDMLAIAAMGGCRDLGLRVPEDVSVTGFDGIAVGEMIQPSLTTVQQPTREMGLQAVEHLLALIEGGTAPRHIILPHRLRIGGSAGPPGEIPAMTRSAAQKIN